MPSHKALAGNRNVLPQANMLPQTMRFKTSSILSGLSGFTLSLGVTVLHGAFDTNCSEQ